MADFQLHIELFTLLFFQLHFSTRFNQVRGIL